MMRNREKMLDKIIWSSDGIMSLKTPQSLSAEHEELHADLAKAIKAGGATGKAGKGVDCVLHPHFLKEEEGAVSCFDPDRRVSEAQKAVMRRTGNLSREKDKGIGRRLLDLLTIYRAVRIFLCILSEYTPGNVWLFILWYPEYSNGLKKWLCRNEVLVTHIPGPNQHIEGLR
jgi:hypothetical protein